MLFIVNDIIYFIFINILVGYFIIKIVKQKICGFNVIGVDFQLVNGFGFGLFKYWIFFYLRYLLDVQLVSLEIFIYFSFLM